MGLFQCSGTILARCHRWLRDSLGESPVSGPGVVTYPVHHLYAALSSMLQILNRVRQRRRQKSFRDVCELTGNPLCANGCETVHEVSGRVAIQERHDEAEEERRQERIEGWSSRHVYDHERPVRQEGESRRSGLTSLDNRAARQLRGRYCAAPELLLADIDVCHRAHHHHHHHHNHVILYPFTTRPTFGFLFNWRNIPEITPGLASSTKVSKRRFQLRYFFVSRYVLHIIRLTVLNHWRYAQNLCCSLLYVMSSPLEYYYIWFECQIYWKLRNALSLAVLVLLYHDATLCTSEWLGLSASISTFHPFLHATRLMPIFKCHTSYNKKLSWCWQTARRTYRSVKVTKHSTIHNPYVRYFSSCAIVTLSLIRAVFFDIWLQKMSWPWNPGQRSLKVIESGTIL